MVTFLTRIACFDNVTNMHGSLDEEANDNYFISGVTKQSRSILNRPNTFTVHCWIISSTKEKNINTDVMHYMKK